MATSTSSLDDPTAARFREEVLRGLQKPQKELPCKYFYDALGARLFDRICDLPEYYLTRTEIALLNAHMPEIAALVGTGCLLVEYGSGSGVKTRLLLEGLRRPLAYVPVDISFDYLARAAADLRRAYPELPVLPVCADFTGPFELPDLGELGRLPGAPDSPNSGAAVPRRVGFFPGSTIGNFTPAEAHGFMCRIVALCRGGAPGGGLLIGVDLKKPREVLERAYNDQAGVTAAFNLNVLLRINRELHADFQVERFRHDARYNEARGRIEMHLVSLVDQVVHLGADAIALRRDESICTEYSHKYNLDDFAALATSAGFAPAAVWTDEAQLFSVHYLTTAD